MPCLEWSSEVVEWEQGSGPKGPMSCRTQGVISRRPEGENIRPKIGLISIRSRCQNWNQRQFNDLISNHNPPSKPQKPMKNKKRWWDRIWFWKIFSRSIDLCAFQRSATTGSVLKSNLYHILSSHGFLENISFFQLGSLKPPFHSRSKSVFIFFRKCLLRPHESIVWTIYRSIFLLGSSTMFLFCVGKHIRIIR